MNYIIQWFQVLNWEPCQNLIARKSCIHSFSQFHANQDKVFIYVISLGEVRLVYDFIIPSWVRSHTLIQRTDSQKLLNLDEHTYNTSFLV